jgi:hypothetical protein
MEIQLPGFGLAVIKITKGTSKFPAVRRVSFLLPAENKFLRFPYIRLGNIQTKIV